MSRARAVLAAQQALPEDRRRPELHILNSGGLVVDIGKRVASLKGEPPPTSKSHTRIVKSDAQWRKLIREQEVAAKNGEVLLKFAKRHGMSDHTFYTNKKRILGDAYQPKVGGTITTGAKRTYRDLEKWRVIVAEWEASGLTKQSFCKQKKITPSSFNLWSARLGPPTITTNRSPGLLPSTPVVPIGSPAHRAVMEQAFAAVDAPRSTPPVQSFVPAGWDFTEMTVELPGGIRVTYKK